MNDKTEVETETVKQTFELEINSKKYPSVNLEEGEVKNFLTSNHYWNKDLFLSVTEIIPPSPTAVNFYIKNKQGCEYLGFIERYSFDYYRVHIHIEGTSGTAHDLGYLNNYDILSIHFDTVNYNHAVFNSLRWNIENMQEKARQDKIESGTPLFPCSFRFYNDTDDEDRDWWTGAFFDCDGSDEVYLASSEENYDEIDFKGRIQIFNRFSCTDKTQLPA